jgi:hypothetical protein
VERAAAEAKSVVEVANDAGRQAVAMVQEESTCGYGRIDGHVEGWLTKTAAWR